MKKLSVIALALALSLSMGSAFAKGKKGTNPCAGLKGKERAECVKAEKAKKVEKKAEAKPAAAPAAGESK